MLTARTFLFLSLLSFFGHELSLCVAAKEQDVDKEPFVIMQSGHIIFSPMQNTRFGHMWISIVLHLFQFLSFFLKFGLYSACHSSLDPRQQLPDNI